MCKQNDNIEIIDVQTDMIEALNDRIEELEDELDLLRPKCSLSDIQELMAEEEKRDEGILGRYITPFFLGLGLFFSLFASASLFYYVLSKFSIVLVIVCVVAATWFCWVIGNTIRYIWRKCHEGE